MTDNYISLYSHISDNYISWYNHINDICYKIIQYLHYIELPSNPVVVFDIDDTLLHSNGSCIIPIVNLYNHVKMIGIIPIIITNRLGIPDVIEFTQKQLKKCCIHGYKHLYFRHPEKDNNPYRYKEKARYNIHERGMNIVMTIGDQQWDTGNYGGVGIIIPTL